MVRQDPQLALAAGQLHRIDVSEYASRSGVTISSWRGMATSAPAGDRTTLLRRCA